MGKRTILGAEEFDLGTGNVLVAFKTAAAGSLAARVGITRCEIFQNGTTTLEMIRGEFATRDTAGTLTLTATTPQAVSPLGSAASGLSGNTAPAGGDGRSGTNSSADSGGTYVSKMPFNFANLNGYLFKADYDEIIWVPASTVFVVRLTATPSSALDWGIALHLIEE